MQCENCGHKPELHGDQGCNMRILTGWNEQEKRWTGHRECFCTGFVAPPAPPEDACPHETVRASNLCVHCHRPVAVESER
jgi:hypothetical protein